MKKFIALFLISVFTLTLSTPIMAESPFKGHSKKPLTNSRQSKKKAVSTSKCHKKNVFKKRTVRAKPVPCANFF